MSEYHGFEIAIIGMAGQFPEARDLSQFFKNVMEGRECIRTFSPEELRAAGVPEAVIQGADHLKRAGVMDDVDLFDAAFFGYTAREAELMDPQQRLFLQCAWQAVEDAGLDPERFAGRIGVFAGCSSNTYLLNNLCRSPHVEEAGTHALLLGNEKDFLCTRVSFKLKLTGPSVTVQTACSTSLVAVHMACQSILNGECDAALAGGVSIRVPQVTGYRIQEGSILSTSGTCRPFDHEACGTLASDGVGIVVLKRLQEALRDGDQVYAVIKGSAINNDGAEKVGFTAPSVAGQRRVILEALELAGVPTETISYLETHGTGTRLGDPIEISALKQAYGERPGDPSLTLGAVKANIGHTDTASGIAGLIKTALMLRHGVLPPQIHFTRPNPHLGLEGSPFRIQTQGTPWPAQATPRRAAVSAFGLGGTNAHVVLEEAPAAPRPSAPAPAPQAILVSARTATALSLQRQRLRETIASPVPPALEDLARTLARGRKAMEHRFFVVAESLPELAGALADADHPLALQGEVPKESPRVELEEGTLEALPTGFLTGMCATFPVFQETLEACLPSLEALHPGAGTLAACLDEVSFTNRSTAFRRALSGAIALAFLRVFQSLAIPVQTRPGSLLDAVLAQQTPLAKALEEMAQLPSGSGLHLRLETMGLPASTFSLLPPSRHAPKAGFQHLLGQLWVAGVTLDFGLLFEGTGARTVSLPPTCFEGKRYWIDPTPTRALPATETATAKVDHDSLKASLRALWQEILGVDQVNDMDDLFELCGDSFTSLQMNLEIENRFGVKLPMKSMVECSTLDLLAARLLSHLQPIPAVTACEDPLVVFRSQGTRAPIFLVHPAGGTLMGYKALVKRIPEGYPVYGIEYPFRDGQGRPRSMEDLAKHYLACVTQRCPTGPLILGGHSFGGNAAFEMALQLERQGRPVERLLMFDSHPPAAYFSREVFSESLFLQAFPVIFGLLSGSQDIPEDMDTSSLESVFGELKARQWIPWGLGLEEFRMFYGVWRQNHNTLRGHMPSGKIRTPIHFFRAQVFQPQRILDALNITLAPDMDLAEWPRFTIGGIQFHDVPGSHYTMLEEPHVEAIAPLLQHLLEAAPCVRV